MECRGGKGGLCVILWWKFVGFGSIFSFVCRESKET